MNGPAIGAGMQLAVACDFRVAARAPVRDPGRSKLGIHAQRANIWRLAHLVGQGTAREFLLAGRTSTPRKRSGSGSYSASSTMRWAMRCGRGRDRGVAPLTVQGHKRALNLVAEAAWLSSDDRGRDRALEARRSRAKTSKKGLAAFAEKRTANFKGR